MTMPHLMNCPHSDDSWCLDCVKAEWERTDAEIERLQAELDRLPKTADLRPLPSCELPMTWIAHDGSILDVTGWYMYDDGVYGVRTRSSDGMLATFIVSTDERDRLWSTREAAEKAR